MFKEVHLFSSGLKNSSSFSTPSPAVLICNSKALWQWTSLFNWFFRFWASFFWAFHSQSALRWAIASASKAVCNWIRSFCCCSTTFSLWDHRIPDVFPCWGFFPCLLPKFRFSLQLAADFASFSQPTSLFTRLDKLCKILVIISVKNRSDQFLPRIPLFFSGEYQFQAKINFSFILQWAVISI